MDVRLEDTTQDLFPVSAHSDFVFCESESTDLIKQKQASNQNEKYIFLSRFITKFTKLRNKLDSV